MGYNVCVKVLHASAEMSGDDRSIHFRGKIELRVIDEDSRKPKLVEWQLGDVDEFARAYSRIGKISYATVELIEGIAKVWFLDKSPFKDNWREEVFLSE